MYKTEWKCSSKWIHACISYKLVESTCSINGYVGLNINSRVNEVWNIQFHRTRQCAYDDKVVKTDAAVKFRVKIMTWRKPFLDLYWIVTFYSTCHVRVQLVAFNHITPFKINIGAPLTPYFTASIGKYCIVDYSSRIDVV